MPGETPRLAEPVPQPPLTQREKDILCYLPTRLSNAEIAEQLGISENTVKTHLKSLHRKLGAPTRHKAIDAAVSRGMLARYHAVVE